MSNSNQPTAEPDKLHTKSSIYAKVLPELRAQINQAIADADPPSYRGIYDKFNLESLGVTFTPFYYYARRIRHHVQLVEIAHLGGPPDADTAAAVHKLVVQRFIEIMLREEVSSHCMLRLANTYRITAQARPDKQKSADTEAWTKVLRAVMSLPPTLAELEEAARKSNHAAPSGSEESLIPPAPDPRFSEVAAAEMKKMLLDRIRPALDAQLDPRERLASNGAHSRTNTTAKG